MSRVHLLTSVGVPALLLSACVEQAEQDQVQTIRTYFPEAELSVDGLDFGSLDWDEVSSRTFVLSNTGELPMGVGSIAVLEDNGYGENFTLTCNSSELICDETYVPPEDEESAKGMSPPPDSGSPDDTGDGGGSTGSSGDDTGDPPDEGGDDICSGGAEPVIIPGGCGIEIGIDFSPVNVGQIYGSVQIDLVTEPNPDPENSQFEPAYWRDPDEFKKKILMEGSAAQGQGNIVVNPLSVDMGHLWIGETSTRYIYVYNVGDGDLNLQDPYFADDCDDGFAMDLSQYDSPSGSETDGLLPAGTSTLIAVTFNPEEDTDTKKCELFIESDDLDTPSIEVKLQGNSGEDPENVPPTVSIAYPPVGYVHTTGEPVLMKINMFDENQPATSLLCKVKSAVLQQASLVKCVPEDESGYVEVEIDIDLLDPGVDTLLVTVTDSSEKTAQDSTTILFKTDYPDSDDDGDGFGENTDPEDCDDLDASVYPEAAEHYDGKDNDCDGGVDEGTLGKDDDGDSVSELEGDCDDRDPSTHPDGYELADQKDNDCDGIVDEGTSLYDDDGDGFAEVDLDCNDDDPGINPAAVEYCDDGIDNNCNGLKDSQEDCVSFDSAPVLIGEVFMEFTAIGQGESTTMSVFPFDSDGQEVSCTWNEDTDLVSRGHTAIDNPTAYTINWTAPSDLDEDSPGELYNVYVVCEDEDQVQDWAFDEVLVYPEPVLPYQEDIIQPEEGGCGQLTEGYAGARGTPAASDALILVPGVGLLAFARRFRRRDEEG